MFHALRNGLRNLGAHENKSQRRLPRAPVSPMSKLSMSGSLQSLFITSHVFDCITPTSQSAVPFKYKACSKQYTSFSTQPETPPARKHWAYARDEFHNVQRTPIEESDDGNPLDGNGMPPIPSPSDSMNLQSNQSSFYSVPSVIDSKASSQVYVIPLRGYALIPTKDLAFTRGQIDVPDLTALSRKRVKLSYSDTTALSINPKMMGCETFSKTEKQPSVNDKPVGDQMEDYSQNVNACTYDVKNVVSGIYDATKIGAEECIASTMVPANVTRCKAVKSQSPSQQSTAVTTNKSDEEYTYMFNRALSVSTSRSSCFNGSASTATTQQTNNSIGTSVSDIGTYRRNNRATKTTKYTEKAVQCVIDDVNRPIDSPEHDIRHWVTQLPAAEDFCTDGIAEALVNGVIELKTGIEIITKGLENLGEYKRRKLPVKLLSNCLNELSQSLIDYAEAIIAGNVATSCTGGTNGREPVNIDCTKCTCSNCLLTVNKDLLKSIGGTLLASLEAVRYKSISDLANRTRLLECRLRRLLSCHRIPI